MLFTFDLQMFNVAIPGIDEDVLEQFKDELPQESETDDQNAEPATADADSDNKEPEQDDEQDHETVDTEGEEEVPEGSSVPYGRFKGVNDRMKAAEARQRELEAELAKYKNPAAQQQTQASPAPAQQTTVGDFNAEQIKVMTAEARRRAAHKLNLTDEDIENMDYADDPNIKASYDALTAQYMGDVKQEVVTYQKQQQAYLNDIQSTAADYKKMCEEFNADPEHDAKWAKLCEAAQKCGEHFMMTCQAAIDRLNVGKGTSGDFYLVKNFMDGVLSSQQTTVAPAKPKPHKKIQEAAKLPVAPTVGGTIKGDTVWDVPTITEYLNSGRMDEIPPNVLNKIMGQSIAPGDFEE